MEIKSQVQKLSEISVIVSVVLDFEDARKLKSTFNKNLTKNSKVEGFRKGKAPLNLVINKIGQDEYYKNLREYIASEAFNEVAKKDERIKPVIPPKFEFADWEEGKKFVFTALVYIEPPDPNEMFIKPDFDVPSVASPEKFSKQIPGIPGQMPIISGKLPPHLAGVDPTPQSPEIPQKLPAGSKIQQEDPTAPIHKIPKRPDQLLKTPQATSKTKSKKESDSNNEPSDK